MQAIIEVPFHGDILLAAETPEAEFVAIKPISDRLGLSWPAQYRKITSNKSLWAYCLMAMETAAGDRETLCLPLNRVAMWLASISANKVLPEAREKLIAYQTEAADVLDRHFRLRAQEREEALTELRETNRRLRAIALAFNPTANKIARLQEAGVGVLEMPAYIRRSREQTDDLISTLEDAGILDFAHWGAEKRYSHAERWAKRRAPAPEDDQTGVEAAVEQMALAFPEA